MVLAVQVVETAPPAAPVADVTERTHLHPKASVPTKKAKSVISPRFLHKRFAIEYAFARSGRHLLLRDAKKMRLLLNTNESSSGDNDTETDTDYTSYTDGSEDDTDYTSYTDDSESAAGKTASETSTSTTSDNDENEGSEIDDENKGSDIDDDDDDAYANSLEKLLSVYHKTGIPLSTAYDDIANVMAKDTDSVFLKTRWFWDHNLLYRRPAKAYSAARGLGIRVYYSRTAYPLRLFQARTIQKALALRA